MPVWPFGTTETLRISDGYELRLTWDEKRGTLNQSPLYRALSESNGLLDARFVEKAETLAKFSRRIDAALELSGLVREVATGKGPTPVELWGRAARFLGLRESTLIEAAREIPRIESGGPLMPESADAGSVSPANGLSAVTSPTSSPPSRDLFGLAMNVITGQLTDADKARIFEGVRGEALETSRKIEGLDSELRELARTKVPFVEHSPLFECRCGPMGTEAGITCPLCAQGSIGHPHSVCRIRSDFDRIIAENIWMELGVARLFEAAGFATYVGVHPIGFSGAKHEVDVLAWDADQRLLIVAETTTDRASINRLGRVLLRAVDIRPHSTVLVSLAESDDEAVIFGKRHSIKVIPRIRENTDQLRNWIQSTRGAHGHHPKK